MLRSLTSHLTRRLAAPSRTGWFAAVAVGVCIAPAIAHAQDQMAQDSAAAGRTHVVKEGDTLWELARVYLNDPFQWPEIYRINTSVVEDPHWIYPGEQLAIPGPGAANEAPPVIAVSDDPTAVVAGTEAALPTTDETVIPSRPGPSLFSQQRKRGPSRIARAGIMGREEFPAVREGEFFAAPYVVREGSQRDAGQILKSWEVSAIAEATGRTRLHLNEKVYITPPKGSQPAAGSRYLAYMSGGEIEGTGEVLIPTAILEVITPGGENEASLARIDRVFEDVKLHQRLVPVESFDMAPGGVARPGEFGSTGNVIWIKDNPVLPSLQRYLVLSTTSRDGVRMGDEFTIVRRRERTEKGIVLPEQEIAVAQVVRVTQHGTTVLVVDQTQPKIKRGQLARLTARMP
jgi:LysM repeat protein